MILFIMSVTISLYLQSTNAATITIFGLSTVNMGKLSMYLLPDLCNYFGQLQCTPRIYQMLLTSPPPCPSSPFFSSVLCLYYITILLDRLFTFLFSMFHDKTISTFAFYQPPDIFLILLHRSCYGKNLLRLGFLYGFSFYVDSYSTCFKRHWGSLIK